MSNKNRKVRNFNGNNNSMELTVDTGVRTYIIKNTQGRQIGELVFNPTDTDIISRYETVIDRHDLWHLFGRKQTKTATREESR